MLDRNPRSPGRNFVNNCRHRVISWLLILLGLMVLAIGFKKVLVAAASKNWPTVPGVVVESGVAANPPAAGAPRQVEQATTSYGAHIRYEFSVDGKKFQGERIGPADYSASYKSRVDEVAARYPKDGEVTVYYQPSNPAECLLEPGVAFQTWLLPALGVVLLAVGAFWLRSQR